MAWTISYTDTAKKQLKKLDKSVARRIMDYMDSRVSDRDNPRLAGKALSGDLGELWRYRVGDFRVICNLEDEICNILVVKLGHRKDIYQ